MNLAGAIVGLSIFILSILIVPSIVASGETTRMQGGYTRESHFIMRIEANGNVHPGITCSRQKISISQRDTNLQDQRI
jgi:hypothetical protein